MILLGIDPGTQYLGFSLLTDPKKPKLLQYGCLKLNPKSSIPDRLEEIHTFFAAKILSDEVTHMAIETPFLGKNIQSFMKLCYVRGILYLLATQNDLVLYEYSPTEVKKAVCAFGGAPKDQVARVLWHMFKGLETNLRDDITDAIAVGLTGLWKK